MNIKDKKGSITLFVIIGMVFMSSFLLILYANNLNKSKFLKEQYDMISSIYYKNESDKEIYDAVYADIREKNKKTGMKAKSALFSSSLEMKNTHEVALEDYRIYARNEPFLGEYNTKKQKYEIQIEVTNLEGKTKIYKIYMSGFLGRNEYIDYKNQRVAYENPDDGVIITKENIEVPIIYAYDDYTKIEVIYGGIPKMIEATYTGYTLD